MLPQAKHKGKAVLGMGSINPQEYSNYQGQTHKN